VHRSHGPSRRHTYQFIVHSILHKMQWMDGVYLQGKAINRPTHRTEVSLSDSLKMALFLGSPARPPGWGIMSSGGSSFVRVWA